MSKTRKYHLKSKYAQSLRPSGLRSSSRSFASLPPIHSLALSVGVSTSRVGTKMSSWKNSTLARGTENATVSTVWGVRRSALMISTARTSLRCLDRNANPACSVPCLNDGRRENSASGFNGWSSKAWQERSPRE
mgnify:CR=1 FL=1